MKALGKIFVYILVILLIFPLFVLFNLFITCKDYIWSVLISAGVFYLILGFTGISCLLTIALSIILTSIGQAVYNKTYNLVSEGIDRKKNKLSDVEKSQYDRSNKIDSIIGRLGGIN